MNKQVFYLSFIKFYLPCALLSLCNVYSVRAQEYPPCLIEIGYPIYGSPSGFINVTDLPAQLPNSFGIVGSLIINQNTTWGSKTVVMFGGSQIVIRPGAAFSLVGTVVQGCDKMWKGIFMSGNAGISLSGGARISDAVRAVESVGTNTIWVDNASLTRNFYGLNFYNSNDVIDLSVSSLSIDGAGPLKPPYPGQPSDLYGPRGKAGLFFTNLASFSSYFSSPVSTVKNCEIGAWIKGCAGALFQFRFEDILWYHVKPLGTAVLIQDGIPNHPDGIIVSACQFVNCNTGIDADNSRVTFIGDILSKVNTGIRIRNALSNEGSQIYNCTIDGANDGIMLGPNQNSSIHLDGDTVRNVAEYGIYLTDQATSITNSQYTVEHCSVSIKGNEALSPRSNDNAIGIWATQIGVNGDHLKIQSNYINLPGSNTGLNNTGIAITNCHSANIKKNHVMQDVPNAAAKHVAMFYENTNFTNVECNDFLNTDVGLRVSGSQNTPTAIKTNQFKYHTSAGMVFSGLTQSFHPSGDHIHAGNLWLYPTNASNPGAVSTLSANANALMQFIVDAAENQAFLPYVSGDNWFVDQDNQGITPTCDPYSALVEPNGTADRDNTLPEAAAPQNGTFALKIIPNPSFGDITVSWDATGDNSARLEIINSTGNTVYATTVEANGRIFQRVDGLQPGIYLCRVVSSSGRVSLASKVIVH